jgi:hypothetical protein
MALICVGLGHSDVDRLISRTEMLPIPKARREIFYTCNDTSGRPIRCSFESSKYQPELGGIGTSKACVSVTPSPLIDPR